MDEKYVTTITSMVFNITCNTISAISWRSVLLAEQTGVHRETTYMQLISGKLYHILYRAHSVLSGIRAHNFNGDSTDCKSSCKFNYHMITMIICLLQLHVLNAHSNRWLLGLNCTDMLY